MHSSRDALLVISSLRSLCCTRPVFYFYFISSILYYSILLIAAWGGGEGAARLSIFYFFPCPTDYEQDWPQCKVVFFGLATNTLNLRCSFPPP